MLGSHNLSSKLLKKYNKNSLDKEEKTYLQKRSMESYDDTQKYQPSNFPRIKSILYEDKIIPNSPIHISIIQND